MSDVGLNIKISADVRAAAVALGGLNDNFVELVTEANGSITSINLALEGLRKAARDAGNTKDLGLFNRAIKDLSGEASRLGRAGTEGFDEFGNAAKKALGDNGVLGAANTAYSSIRKLAFILPGIGVAGIFGLIGTGVLDVVKDLGFFNDKLISTADLTKKAEAEAKKLHETLVNLKTGTEINESATGSQEGDISRVRALAAAIQDTSKSYKERQNALTELRETNKAYFGDLTLETASLATLSAKVQEYSNALIQEAVVKGNVEEIAKLSSEYLKQVRILDTLKEARDKALIDQAKPQANIGAGGTGTVGGLNISESARLASAVSRTTDAFNKQLEAVVLLKGSIDDYKGDLDDAIGQQIKLDLLKTIRDPKVKDELKAIIPILEQIKRIYDDLAKPDKDPLFKQLAASTNINDIKLIQAQIAEAIKKGATDGAKSPELRAAYDDLVKALGSKLDRLQNPNLSSRIRGIVDVTEEPIDKVQSQIDKVFGKQIHLKMTPQIEAEINGSGFSSQNISRLRRLIEDQLKNNIPVINFQAEAKLLIRKEQLKEASQKLVDQIESAINGAEKSGLEGIGESIGKAIASGKNPITAAGDAILSSIGDLIEQIGKALVEYGIVKEGLDAVIEGGFALPGIAAIAVGVGAIAIGELIKSSFKPARAMADGGILTGPQMVLAGEAGPEAFMPLDRVNDFLKNVQPASTSVNIDHTIKVQGSDLLIVMKRAQKNQSLVS